MKTISNRAYLFLLLGALFLFIAFKISDTWLPYFWDELGVYTRAAYYLAEHGLGLMPSQLPPGLSRGHPLLFSFIYGLAYKLMGFNVYAGHGVSLAVSVILLASVYYIVKKISGPLQALLCMCLLAVQPLFYAQSVLVLPEMLLTLFALWSIYAFYRQHFLLFAVFACMAILIKESAITIPVAAFAWALLNVWPGPGNRAYLTARSFVLICSPIVVFILFLLIQKQQNGWYFFPEHAEAISFSTETIWLKISSIWHFMFSSQGKQPWLFVFVAALVIVIIKGKVKMYGSFTSLGIVFTAVYIAFCCLNFYMDRYLLPVMPVISILLIVGLLEIYNNHYFLVIVSVLFILASVSQMNPNRFNYDCDMSYKNVLAVEQQAADYIAANIDTSRAVVATFPMNLVLYCPNTGFNINRHYPLTAPGPAADYLIEDSETGPIAVPRKKYTLFKTFKSGFAEVSISGSDSISYSHSRSMQMP